MVVQCDQLGRGHPLPAGLADTRQKPGVNAVVLQGGDFVDREIAVSRRHQSRQKRSVRIHRRIGAGSVVSRRRRRLRQDDPTGRTRTSRNEREQRRCGESQARQRGASAELAPAVEQDLDALAEVRRGTRHTRGQHHAAPGAAQFEEAGQAGGIRPRLAGPRYHPIVRSQLSFACDLAHHPGRHRVQPGYRAQAAGQEIGPIVAARHVRQFMQQDVVQFAFAKLRQQRGGQNHGGMPEARRHGGRDLPGNQEPHGPADGAGRDPVSESLVDSLRRGMGPTFDLAEIRKTPGDAEELHQAEQPPEHHRHAKPAA